MIRHLIFVLICVDVELAQYKLNGRSLAEWCFDMTYKIPASQVALLKNVIVGNAHVFNKSLLIVADGSARCCWSSPECSMLK